jgi:hypothetical protein
MAAGVAGVVVAHLAGYMVVFPQAGHRSQALAVSGHGYWHVAVMAAITAAVCAGASAFWRGVRRARRHTDDRRPRGDVVGGWLALARFQVVLFTAMEVGERMSGGHSPLTVLHERVFLVGLVLQGVVAAAAILVLWLLERAGVRVEQALARRHPPVAEGRSRWRRTAGRPPLAGSPFSVQARAPPLPS